MILGSDSNVWIQAVSRAFKSKASAVIVHRVLNRERNMAETGRNEVILPGVEVKSSSLLGR